MRKPLSMAGAGLLAVGPSVRNVEAMRPGGGSSNELQQPIQGAPSTGFDQIRENPQGDALPFDEDWHLTNPADSSRGRVGAEIPQFN